LKNLKKIIEDINKMTKKKEFQEENENLKNKLEQSEENTNNVIEINNELKNKQSALEEKIAIDGEIIKDLKKIIGLKETTYLAKEFKKVKKEVISKANSFLKLGLSFSGILLLILFFGKFDLETSYLFYVITFVFILIIVFCLNEYSNNKKIHDNYNFKEILSQTFSNTLDKNSSLSEPMRNNLIEEIFKDPNKTKTQTLKELSSFRKILKDLKELLHE
jgi:hypothetical protein